MAQHFSRPPTAPQPFSEAQDPALTSGLFWVRLLAYRPLFLLGGLWLTLVCVSAIAYHGLMSHEPAPDIAHREAPIAIAAPLPQDLEPATATDAGDREPSNTELASADNTELASAEAPQLGTVTLWGLLSLVGLCAFGCFVLTQQIKASSRPKRKQPRPVAKAAAPARPPHPKRLTPYLPERDGMVVSGARARDAAAMPQTATPAAFRPVKPASPVPAAVAQTWPQPMPARLVASQAQVRTPAVVPESADLPLDWSEGSVAHALDVRQRRSLSSFM